MAYVLENSVKSKLLLVSILCLLTACHAPHLIRPNSVAYDAARLLFNKGIKRAPAGIIYCHSNRDVAYAINYARKHKLPIRLRAGNHSYEGQNSVDGGLVIDLSRMTRFSYDPKTQVATLGAGIQLYPFYQMLDRYQRFVPAGSCPTVGLAGLTLGGGIGFSSRLKGLTIDNVQSLEMVDYRGRLLQASTQEHPELFWALLGAGHNSFGAITQLSFKTHQSQPVVVFKLVTDWRYFVALSRSWFKVRAKAPDELMLFLHFAKMNGKKTVAVFGQFHGTETELQKHLKAFLDISPKFKHLIEIKTLPFLQSVEYWAKIDISNRLTYQDDVFNKRRAFKANSIFIEKPLSSVALQVIKKLYEDPNLKDAFTVLDSYGGAIARPRMPTAFAHRTAIASMQTLSYWDNDQDRAHQQHWARTFYQTLSPHGCGSYRNYEDLDLKNWGALYYKQNFERLKAIKQHYDPLNIFNTTQSIPLP